MSFLEYLNKQHVNILFTFEKEINWQVSFLDVLIENTNSASFVTSVYSKSTFTRLMF